MIELFKFFASNWLEEELKKCKTPSFQSWVVKFCYGEEKNGRSASLHALLSVVILKLVHLFSQIFQSLQETNVDVSKKWEIFPKRYFSVNVTKSEVSADMVTFTEKILNGKLHFFVQCWKCAALGHKLLPF